MKHGAAPGYRCIERGAIAQVTGDPFHLQFPELACRTAQCTDRVAALSEDTSNMPSEKSASAGDKGRFQESLWSQLAQRSERAASAALAMCR